jgi:hypothetical protein
MNHKNPNCLKEQFAAYDLKNESILHQITILDVLSFPSFRSAFLKLDIGLTMNEISRLARQC